jgi:4a-hydroxytetrahydrobiopterin dehydratase
MMNKARLANEVCEPCGGGVPPMPMKEALLLLKELNQAWSINAVGHLERVFLMKDFLSALRLASQLGEMAEASSHHPDLLVSYGKLAVEIWTHKIDGLSRADFVLAAKFDEIT